MSKANDKRAGSEANSRRAQYPAVNTVSHSLGPRRSPYAFYCVFTCDLASVFASVCALENDLLGDAGEGGRRGCLHSPGAKGLNLILISCFVACTGRRSCTRAVQQTRPKRCSKRPADDGPRNDIVIY